MFHKGLFGLYDLGNYPYYIFLEFCASVLFYDNIFGHIL